MQATYNLGVEQQVICNNYDLVTRDPRTNQEFLNDLSLPISQLRPANPEEIEAYQRSNSFVYAPESPMPSEWRADSESEYDGESDAGSEASYTRRELSFDEAASSATPQGTESLDTIMRNTKGV